MKMNYSIRDFDEINPIDEVDDGYILSKEGDITVGWELTLPCITSVSRDSYDVILRSMASAIRSLPDWTVVHRQDLYMNETYKPEPREAFLDKCYERHFEDRVYIKAEHYLYLTFSNRAGAMRDAMSSGLFGISLTRSLPTESQLREFIARSEEFITVFCSGTAIQARRLTTDDLLGEDDRGGLIDRIRFLGEEMSSVGLEPDGVTVNNNKTVCYTIADSDLVPSEVETVTRHDSMSSACSEVVLGLSAPVGCLLEGHPHINNLYIVKANQQTVYSELDKKILRQSQFSTDGGNKDNCTENKQYISDANNDTLCAVYCHCNIISWASTEAERLRIRSDISAAVSSMGITASRNIVSAPILWYSSIPGAACSLSKEHLMLCELRAALALAQYESFDTGFSRGAFKLTDRFRHIPIRLDIQAEAAKRSLINNYNIFLNGPSGTGKSFTTSSILYSLWSYGEHIFIIDIGGSYEQVCGIIREESGGRDGVYNRWDNNHPFSFNPFSDYLSWFGENDVILREQPSLNFLVSLLMTLGTDADKGIVFGDFEENIILYFITEFISQWKASHKNGQIPIFNDYIAWVRNFLIYGEDAEESVRGTMRPFITRSGVRVDSSIFKAGHFVEAISAYGVDGQFGFLLNSREPKDLFTSRFTVFDVGELSSVSNVKFYSVCVLCIVNAFDVKMRSKDISGFKVMAIDEAWKAISNRTMAPYLRELWKTARKMNTSAMVITQEIDDIISSDIIKETILQNSDIKILMSQDNYRNNPDKIAGPLGLTEQDISLIFSMAGKEKRSKDTFIKWGAAKSGVYTVEACAEQLWAFESNLEKKAPLFALAEQTGSLLTAIEQITNPQSGSITKK